MKKHVKVVPEDPCVAWIFAVLVMAVLFVMPWILEAILQ